MDRHGGFDRRPIKKDQIAEHLYQQGLLSYPRTETDIFDPQFDFMTLINKQTQDPAWGGFADGFVVCSA